MQACGTQTSAALDFRPSGRTRPCCMSLTMNKRELFGPSPQVAHGPNFNTEVSGSIEPYRAMPLLAISNTLNADGLATSAPKFWENSWLTWLDIISWRDHNCWRRQLWPWLEYLGLQRAVRWADRKSVVEGQKG